MENELKKQLVDFTIVSNKVLRDKNISFRAKGLFAYIYSMKDGWDFAIERMCMDSADGKKSIASAVNELKAGGYLTTEKQVS